MKRLVWIIIAGIVCLVAQTTGAGNGENSASIIQLQGVVLETPLIGNISAARKQTRHHPLASDGPVRGWSASWVTNFVPDTAANVPKADMPGFTYVAGFSNGFMSTIAALCEDHNCLTVVSEPNLMVAPSEATIIPAGYQLPHFGSSYGVSEGQASEQDRLCEVAFSLNITATISSEGLIALDIHSIADKVTGTPEGSRANAIHIESASSHASVTLRSGDIILFGGAIRTFAATPVFGGPALKKPDGLRSLFHKSKVAPVSREVFFVAQPIVRGAQ